MAPLPASRAHCDVSTLSHPTLSHPPPPALPPPGVLAYELLTGRPPFRGQNRQQVSQAIMTQQPKYPPWLSSAAVDFMTRVLTKSAAKRPDMEWLLAHPWIAANADAADWARVHPTATAAAPADVPEPAGVERSNLSFTPEMLAQQDMAHRWGGMGRLVFTLDGEGGVGWRTGGVARGGGCEWVCGASSVLSLPSPPPLTPPQHPHPHPHHTTTPR